MIYLWFPGFQESKQDIDISKVNTPWNDLYTPLGPFEITAIRDKIILHNPVWMTDVAKPQEVIVKRAMNSTMRTYVRYDRYANMNYRTAALRFENLFNERKKALEHFLLCAEGHYVGYKDPYDQFHIVLVLTSDVSMTSNK